MPLFKTIEITPNTVVYVWKITESKEELDGIYLSSNSVERLHNMKSVSHQKGFLSIRHLLHHIGLQDDQLYYNNYGKPFLTTKQYISITHSFDFSAIVISDKNVGIDIEKNRDKIIQIQHRFTETAQNNLPKVDFIKKLTFIWGAKEAMYKIHPCGGMRFKNDLKLIHFNSKTGKGFIDTPELKQFCSLYFYSIENYSLATAIPYEYS